MLILLYAWVLKQKKKKKASSVMKELILNNCVPFVLLFYSHFDFKRPKNYFSGIHDPILNQVSKFPLTTLSQILSIEQIIKNFQNIFHLILSLRFPGRLLEVTKSCSFSTDIVVKDIIRFV